MSCGQSRRSTTAEAHGSRHGVPRRCRATACPTSTLLSAEHAGIFQQTLDAQTATATAAGRAGWCTADRRRADTLVGFLDTHTTVAVTVDVVISADALIADNASTPQSERLGPIASEVARDLCTSPDARRRRPVTDSRHRRTGRRDTCPEGLRTSPRWRTHRTTSHRCRRHERHEGGERSGPTTVAAVCGPTVEQDPSASGQIRSARPGQASPRRLTAGCRVPAIAWTMCSTSKVSRTSCTR